MVEKDGIVRRLIEISHNLTERRKAEIEREKLQARYLQSQKMESIGRLAGGVAHDFNNMLGVILGQVDLLNMSFSPGDQIAAGLKEIQKAATRSADLTRQLLAFARKQTVAPRVIDLNEAIKGMLNLIRRLIGENIELGWNPDPTLHSIHIDPSQIDQILVNLCVNARDAIHGVGKITIETRNIFCPPELIVSKPDLVPGEYVQLIVSDNGCGMDKETQRNIFEPFFTTKNIGKGTGLGLATVYGVVMQNRGFISVYSEPGFGTTFKISFPKHLGGKPDLIAEPILEEVSLEGKTVLLVEDEPIYLETIRDMLHSLGFHVLTANSPRQAMEVFKGHQKEIHLLLTDVIMPGMNGRELSQFLSALIPGLKCLYMSGYTANVIAHHGVLEEGVNFLQKPFQLTHLREKIGETLRKR